MNTPGSTATATPAAHSAELDRAVEAFRHQLHAQRVAGLAQIRLHQATSQLRPDEAEEFARLAEAIHREQDEQDVQVFARHRRRVRAGG